MTEFLSEAGTQVLAAIAVALAGATLLDDMLADLVARIPGVGRFLAPVARRLSGHFRQWIGSRVPAQADRVVLQIEAEAAGAAGVVKAKLATAALLDAEPGLTRAEAASAVQAAVDRAKAAASLAGEIDAAEARMLGAVPGDAHAPE